MPGEVRSSTQASSGDTLSAASQELRDHPCSLLTLQHPPACVQHMSCLQAKALGARELQVQAWGATAQDLTACAHDLLQLDDRWQHGQPHFLTVSTWLSKPAAVQSNVCLPSSLSSLQYVTLHPRLS